MNFTITTFILVNTLLFVTLTDAIRPHIRHFAFRFMQVLLILLSIWTGSVAVVSESGYIVDASPASEGVMTDIALLKTWLPSKKMEAFNEEMEHLGSDGIITEMEANYLLGVLEYYALKELKSGLKSAELENSKCLLSD